MTIGQPPLFEATGLMLSVPGRVLIRDLHWRVEPGERWCVIGRNGAGKSTLLRSMAGVQDLMNHYGSLCWRGQDIALIPSEDLAHLRAYAEQTPTGAIGMRAIDFVYAGLWAADRSLDEALALDCLSRCDVLHLAFASWHTLSGGEKQRVALAACFAQQAPALILDEPTSHLDIGHQIALLNSLTELSKQSNCAVVASLHDITLIGRGFTHALLFTSTGGDEGSYIAGTVEDVVNPFNLEKALGHPVQCVVTAEGRRVFIPA